MIVDNEGRIERTKDQGLSFFSDFLLRNMQITSLTNPKIKRVVKLKQRKARDEEGLIIIDGLREITRAKAAGFSLEEIFVCLDLLHKFSGRKAADEVASWGMEVVFVSEEVFEKICFGDRKEGIVALARSKEFPLNDIVLPKNPLVVVLDGVEKPGNFGAILRSCDGAGVDAVIIADAKTEILNPNVIRASTGVVFSMKVMQGAPDDVKDFLKNRGIKIFSATPQAKATYFSVEMTGPTAFVLGAEDRGLSDFWLKAADEQVLIPMKGKADSLNVSATAAILVYEALRQRR